MNERDLEPMAYDRMQKLSPSTCGEQPAGQPPGELPLAYLLAEGVALQCVDDEHQALLNAFDPTPSTQLAHEAGARVRALGLLGEQCYIANVREGDGFVRSSYRPAPDRTVVNDPDNPEQPIGGSPSATTAGASQSTA